MLFYIVSEEKSFVKRLSIVSFFILLLIAALSVAVNGSSYLAANGGNVSSVDEFIAALGGEEAAMAKGNAVTLLSDIELKAPIVLLKGEYELYGSGCHVIRGFDGDAMLILKGSAALTCGNTRGSDDHPSQTFQGNGRSGSFAEVQKGGSLIICVGTLMEQFSSENGAIHITGGSVTMNAGVITDCRSTGNGGAVSMDNGEFTATSATISNNTAALYGGAVWCEGNGKATIVSSSLTGNTAQSGGAVGCGGAGQVVLGDTGFESNTASDRGGTLMFLGQSELYFAGGYVAQSDAEYGGALYNEGTAVLGSGQFTVNKARYAGGVYNTGSLQLTGLSITDNEASVMCGGVYNTGSFILNDGSVSSNKSYGRCGGIFNTGTFYMNEGSVSSNKLKNESYIYGIGIENWGSMTLAEHAFISFNNDVVVGAWPTSDGNITRAQVTIESILTANTPIATFTPVYSEGGYESDSWKLDYEDGRAILTGEAGILTAAAEKLAMTSDPKFAWKLDEAGCMVKNGYSNGNPYLVPILAGSISAVLIAALAAVLILIRRKKKKQSE